MAHDFEITRRVEFSDTDMAGIMHFSNFFRFMESAEHAFFRSLGLSVVLSRSGFPLHLPRVHADCDYLAPLRFEDEVSIRMRVQKKSSRSLIYEFSFFVVSEPVARKVARGRIVVVCAEEDARGRLKAVAFPAAIADLIQEAPPEQHLSRNGSLRKRSRTARRSEKRRSRQARRPS